MIRNLTTPLKPSKSNAADKSHLSGEAAQTYWQELFESEQLSPPEYKYLFPEFGNVDSEVVKDLLTYKLTAELNLVVETDWTGLDAIGLTAFWLKVISEPKIPQLRKCKLQFVTRITELLANSETFSLGVSDEAPSKPDPQVPSQSVSEPASHSQRNSQQHAGYASSKVRTHPFPPEKGSSQSSSQSFTNPSPLPCLNVSITNPQNVPSDPDSPSPKRLRIDEFLTDIVKQEGMSPIMPSLGKFSESNRSNATVLVDDELASVCSTSTNQTTRDGNLSIAEKELGDLGTDLDLNDDNDLDMSDQWTETQTETETVFNCKSCIYKSSYKSRIKQHIRSVHSSVKPYKCDLCDHTTAIRASLTKHINAVHRKVKPFSCHLCGYTCNLKSSLEVHLSGYHQKVYRHTCPHCDYAASAKNVVDIHIQAVHMKEKPYKCPECDYTSAYPQYIPKHIAAVHQRMKPYACPHCDYKSSYKTYLQKHCDAVHNNIKPYSCPHCSYTTSYSQYLSKHISAVHNDEKPYKCPLCDFRCAYKQYINKHIELVHVGAPLDNASAAESGNELWPSENSKVPVGTNAEGPPTQVKSPWPDNSHLDSKPLWPLESSKPAWPGLNGLDDQS